MRHIFDRGDRLLKKFIEGIKLLCDGILPLVFWVSLIFGFDTPDIAILTILSAFLHEIGHIVAIILLKCDTGRLVGHISGFRIKTSTNSYCKDIAVLLAGPIFNLLAFAILTPFPSEYLSLVANINLITALSNLIPIEGYDGYGALEKLLIATGNNKISEYLPLVSILLSITLTFFSLYLLLKIGSGYWFFGVFFTILITKVNEGLKNDVLRE